MRAVTTQPVERLALLATSLAGMLTLAACTSKEEPPPPAPKPAPTNSDAIPSGPLAGEIAGAAFRMRSGRYQIDRRHGYEKVDISLSAAEAESSCGPRVPADAPSVWLRRKGPGPLKPEQIRLAPDDESSWEVHYQRREGQRWVGNGLASALIVIREVAPDLTVTGELWACFADAQSSCVAGRFTASYCPIRIDHPVRGGDTFEQLPKEHVLAPRDAGAGDGVAP